MLQQALIIFVRNPEPGKVKTRIAKDLGDTTALEVYQKLLLHTKSITQNLSVDVFVYYTDYINDNDLWNGAPYLKKIQTGRNLGERMQNAFENMFDLGYENIAIIGSDCFELTQAIIEEAFEQLNYHRAVIGPTKDGGYYLLGMSSLLSPLFANKDWSTYKVYQQTLEDIDALRVSLFPLPVLSDVDTAEDCKKYPGLL